MCKLVVLHLFALLTCAVKKFDPEVVTATVDGVKDWCHSLTAQDVQKGFSDLCQQLAFSILPDQNKEEIVQNWFSCWSNLLSLNGNSSLSYSCCTAMHIILVLSIYWYLTVCATICTIPIPFRPNY